MLVYSIKHNQLNKKILKPIPVTPRSRTSNFLCALKPFIPTVVLSSEGWDTRWTDPPFTVFKQESKNVLISQLIVSRKTECKQDLTRQETYV
jgi:hypothetical protein